jgi:hypothetical protein|tara:strand:+ start:1177 stop:1368 length:192 start_codon:yes stop_codon:yes gene_type:complete
MLGKLGILVAILSLVLLFYLVISFGAGVFTQKEKKPETKKYLRSVNILLILVAVVGTILVILM